MADTAHRKTDLKLEEMESGCLLFIPRRERPYRKRWLIMQSPLMKSQQNYCKPTSGNYITGLLLKSSTADSTKKFKITVDDNGILTATEVTETT